MKRSLKWGVPLLVILLLALVVGRGLMARKAEQARAAAPRAAPVLELAPTDVLEAREQQLVRTLAVSGGLKAVNTAVVKAKVAAEVRDLLVREGDTVRAGQIIGHLDTTEYAARLRQAREQAASAQAQLEIAERTLENNRALMNQGFISKNALDTSVSNAAAARATLLAAQANADIARKAMADTVLRAPIGGQVSQRLVQPGERVGVDAKLLEVVDLSRIELEAAVAPEDVGTVQVGQPALLQVDGLAEPVRARVARINPSTQAGTRAVMVYFAVEPHPGLRHGLFATGRVELDRQALLAVPESAVRLDQPLPYVLVVADGKVVQRGVTLGVRGSTEVGGPAWIAIPSGLRAGEQVLVGSVGLVRDGTPVRLTAMPAPASH